jgi:hypothetical protein
MTTADDAFDYLYLVEWDDSVHRPPSSVLHAITLNPGVSRADFERFMIETGFAMAGEVRTRAGRIAVQHLLAETSGEPPLRFEEIDIDLEPLGQRASVRKFRVLGTWTRPSDA